MTYAQNSENTITDARHENKTTNYNNFRFQHIGEDEGLSQQRILCIIQDQTGFLWLGTDEGLVRYDGYEFKTFSHQPDDTTSISSNGVLSLYEDSSDRLWVGTEKGLNYFDPTSNNFVRLRTIPQSYGEQPSNQVHAITEDNNGAIWVSTNAGISRIQIPSSTKQNQLRSLSSNNEVQIRHFVPGLNNDLSNEILSLLIDRRGNIWIGSKYGLMRLLLSPSDNDSFSFDYLNERFGESTPQLKGNILGLLEDPDGIIWAKTSHGLVRIESPETSVQSLQFKNYPYDIQLFKKGALGMTNEEGGIQLWVNLRFDGFAVFDPQTETFSKNIKEATSPNNATIPHFIHTIYETRNGILWFGTDTGGLYKYDKSSNRFSNSHPKIDQVAYNEFIDMRFVLEDSHDDLWLANRGVYRLDRQTGEVLCSFWTDHEKDDLRWTLKNKIAEDAVGNIWIASEYGGLYRYNRFSDEMVPMNSFGLGAEDSFRTVKEAEVRIVDGRGITMVSSVLSDTLIISENLTALTSDQNGNIWTASTVALFPTDKNRTAEVIYVISKLDIRTKKIERYRLNQKLASSITSHLIYTIEFDKLGTLWIGTKFGLVRLNTQNGAMKVNQVEASGSQSLSNNPVQSIITDARQPERYLWVGTDGGGLCRFDKQLESFDCYSIEDGLPGNTVSSILYDQQDNLWLGTDKGLSNAFIDPETSEIKRFRNYDHSDGIIDDDFSFFYGQTASQNSRGEMFFAGAKGISIFNPAEIEDNPNPPPVVISQFYLNFKKANYGLPNSPLTTAISQVEKLKLSHEDNNFSFDLAALDFHAPEKNQFAYRLEGYQDDWIYLNNERRAVFTKVPPGNYIFHAKAANNDGLWNEEGVKLRVTIIPPWYQTNWAYLLFGLIGLGLLSAGGRYELNRRQLKLQAGIERKETERLKEMDQIKTQFFTNISHEFRTPLALIKGPVEQELEDASSDNTRRRMSMVIRNVNRLFHLINQLLDLSALEAQRVELRASSSDLVAFVHGITMGFASWAERKNISLTIYSKEEKVDVYFDRDLMEKILNNLLSNAIKFTMDGGTIEVAIKKSNDEKQVIIAMKDSGTGISVTRLPNIFDRFYQADASTTREHEGSGIGLALVKELVELHQGNIGVKSKEGLGSIFTITFPLGKKHLHSEQIMASVVRSKRVKKVPVGELDYIANDNIQEAEISPDDTENRPLLLIVEDHTDFRSYIRDILEDDFQIIEADNGQKGVERAIERIPDLIISDVMMPVMDGYGLCKNLKADERTCHIPVILLTAKAAQEDKIEGLEIGADDYLSKPFDSRELKIRVQNLIEQRRSLQAFYQQRVLFKTGSTNVSEDDKFLKKAADIVTQQIEDEQFSVDELAKEIGMSRSQLHRKISALTGKSASHFIRSIRLQRAAELLRDGAGNVTEVAYSVGFSSQSYFTRCFTEQFKCSPSKYIQQNN